MYYKSDFSKHQWQSLSWWADGGVWAMLNAVCLGASNLTTSRIELTATGWVAMSWYITAELTDQSWADRLQPSGHCPNEETNHSSANTLQLRWQVAAQLTSCSWPDSWLDELQLSFHIAAELPYGSWADRLSYQTAAKLTYHGWADKLHLKWQIAKEPCTSKLSWCLAAGLSQQMNCMTEYASAERLQLSWQTVAGLT